MKRFLILVLLLAGLLYAGKRFIEYRYDRELNHYYLLISSQVALSHERVNLEWDGSIVVQNLRARPIDLDLSVSAASVYIKSPKPYETVYNVYRLEQGNLDGQFDVSFNGLLVDGALLSEPQPDDECRSFSMMFNLHAIDMVPYRSNTKLSIDLSNDESAIVRYDTIDALGNYRGSLVFDKNNLAPALKAQSPLAINKASVVARLNPQKAEQMLEYCAQLFEVSREDYLERVVTSKKYSTNSFSMEIGDQARFALSSFLRGEAELTARFYGLGSVDELSFDAMPKSVWRKVDLTLDDVPVALELPEAKKMEVVIAPEEVAQLEQNTPRVKQYEFADVEDAELYLNRKVRLTRTRGRKAIEGRLVATEPGLIKVQIRNALGYITLDISMDDVDLFQVREK